MIGIYKITNKLNNKSYIGQSINLNRRKYDHFYKNNSDIHGLLDAEIKRLGSDQFIFEVLCECEKEDLNTYETYYINLYDTTNPEKGYNLQAIGKQSLNYNQGKQVIDIDTFEIYATTGQCASILNIAQDSVVRVCNHQHGSVAGHKFMYLDEYNKNGIYQYIPKNLNHKVKKVKCIELNKIYDNCHVAARELHLNFRLISSVCTGKRLTTGGYHFEYLSE